MSNSKVLIVNPMTEQTGNVVRDVLYGCWCNGKRIGGGTVPPFTLLVLAAVLRRAGHVADFVDAQAEQIGPDAMAQRVADYDMVAMSTSTMSFLEDAAYLQRFKDQYPDLLTTVFGSHPTFMSQFCLQNPGVDIIVRHEPEEALLEVVDHLSRGEDWRDVKGIGFRGEDGNSVVNEPHPFLEDLDSLPYPDVDLLPKDIDYFNPIVKRLPYITTTTSKGCPGKCTFCTAPAFDGNRYRFQSADYVLAELEYFQSKGFKEVYFRDDTFFVNKKRDHAICQGIIDRGLDLTWIANARVNMISRDTMELARKAGCHTLKFGIESGDQDILDSVKKGYRLEQAYEVFDWARVCGMKTHAHVMIGMPGETLETVHKTIDYVLRLAPTTATFGICTPYPGTPLFDMVQEKCPEIADGSSTDLSRLHVEGQYNEYYTSLKKDQLGDLVKTAYRRFYLRPSYWAKSAKWHLRSMHDVKRLSIAATNLFSFMFK